MPELTHSKTKATIKVTVAQAGAILAGQERSKVKRAKTGPAADEAFNKSGGKWTEKGTST